MAKRIITVGTVVFPRRLSKTERELLEREMEKFEPSSDKGYQIEMWGRVTKDDLYQLIIDTVGHKCTALLTWREVDAPEGGEDVPETVDEELARRWDVWTEDSLGQPQGDKNAAAAFRHLQAALGHDPRTNFKDVLRHAIVARRASEFFKAH